MDGSLVYVSRRLCTEAEIGDIVAVSRSRNAGLGVSGALIASRTRFAQFLEGPRAGIAMLMDSIRQTAECDVDSDQGFPRPTQCTKK